MEFKQLFDDDRAVSPVIGVILMVAITVILAAVIGTFVLGLGDQVQTTTPQASFGFDSTQEDINGADRTAVRITHETGDSIDEADLTVNVDGDEAFTYYDTGSANHTDVPFKGAGDVSAGDSSLIVGYYAGAVNNDSEIDYTATQYAELAEGDTIRVVYDSPDSDSSSTLAKRTVQ